MTGIYWSDGEAAIRTFSSSTKKSAKGIETTVKVEIQINDHHALGYILRQLDEMTAAPKPEKKPPAKAPSAKSKRLALAAPLLQLTYSGDEK